MKINERPALSTFHCPVMCFMFGVNWVTFHRKLQALETALFSREQNLAEQSWIKMDPLGKNHAWRIWQLDLVPGVESWQYQTEGEKVKDWAFVTLSILSIISPAVTCNIAPVLTSCAGCLHVQVCRCVSFRRLRPLIVIRIPVNMSRLICRIIRPQPQMRGCGPAPAPETGRQGQMSAWPFLIHYPPSS